MTISSETRKAGPFPGNGVATAFPFAFKVFAAADLAVTLNVLATGVQTTLTLTSDYTVALNPDQNANPGGTVTYNPSGVPMPSTKTLTIGSALTNTQGYQPTNSGGWLPSNAGDAWDRAVILIQQAAEKVTRSLKFPIVDGALNPELPPAAQRANTLLGFDSNGNVVAVAPIAQSSTALQVSLADSADVTKGASMIGYLGGTLRTFLGSLLTAAQLAASTGSSLIGWIQSGSGAVTRLVRDKLRESVSVLDFGAVGGGITDDSAAIQAALNAADTVRVPTGTYLIGTGLTLKNNQRIEFNQGAKFIAGANSLTFFKSTTTAYYCQIWNASLDGNNKTGVTGFDLTNFRVQSALISPFMTNMTNGIILRTGCFGTNIFNPTTFSGVPYPLLVMDNCSGAQIINPNFDNESGTVTNPALTGTGISIQTSSVGNLGFRVVGGYVQGFVTGIIDSALGTKITDTYFEQCSTADIFASGAINPVYSSTQHWGAAGVVAIKGRNSDGVSIIAPLMGSGNRSTGLLDFDVTNTNSYIFNPGSAASKNAPLGIVSGIGKIPQQVTGVFTPTIVGSVTAGAGTYSVQQGSYTRTGDLVEFHATLTWSAHTGTGNVIFRGLPSTLTPATFSPSKKVNIACLFAFTDPVLYGQLNGSTTNISLIQLSTAGAESFIPLPASGTLHVWGSYELT